MSNLSDFIGSGGGGLSVGQVVVLPASTSDTEIETDSGVLLRSGFVEETNFDSTNGVFPLKFVLPEEDSLIGISTNAISVAVGDGYVLLAENDILRSTDNGLTFTTVESSLPGKIRDIAVSDTYQLAVGDSGTIYRSTDDGQTWSSVSSPTSQNLFTVSIGNGYAIIGGREGSLFYSTNNGQSWSSSNAPIDADDDIFDTAVSDTYQLLVIQNYTTSNYAYVLRSTDGGQTWTQVQFTETDFFGVDLFGVAIDEQNPQNAIVVGDSSIILISNDQGQTWRIRDVDNDTLLYNENFGKVAIDDFRVYITAGYEIFVSNGKIELDDDNTWSRVDVNAQNSIEQIAVSDSFIFLPQDRNEYNRIATSVGAGMDAPAPFGLSYYVRIR